MNLLLTSVQGTFIYTHISVHSALLYSTALYCIVLYSTVLYSKALCTGISVYIKVPCTLVSSQLVSTHCLYFYLLLYFCFLTIHYYYCVILQLASTATVSHVTNFLCKLT